MIASSFRFFPQMSILSQRLWLALILYFSLGALSTATPKAQEASPEAKPAKPVEPVEPTKEAKPVQLPKQIKQNSKDDTQNKSQDKNQEKDLKAEKKIYIEENLYDFSEITYHTAVEAALTRFEAERGAPLLPGPRGKIGLKTYTYSGPGLCTPLALLRSLILALEKRGFTKAGMMIVDFQEKELRNCGILPPLSQGGSSFEGVPVYALDTDLYWDPAWFYESNLPSLEYFGTYLKTSLNLKEAFQKEKISYLNPLLLCDVDGWINLPMLTSHGSIGVSGALANATLLNMSNHKRFLASPSIAPMVVAELAAIPEMRNSWLFTIFSLERYQYVGDYRFNANYTQSEPLLLLSNAPAALDYALLKRLNEARLRRNFAPLGDKQGLFWAYLRELQVP